MLLPDTLPDPMFSRPGSGLYAVAIGDGGFKWESPSAMLRDFSFLRPMQPGEGQFVGPIDTRMGRLYYYAYGAALDTAEKKSVHITFLVAQSEDQYEGPNALFHRGVLGDSGCTDYPADPDAVRSLSLFRMAQRKGETAWERP